MSAQYWEQATSVPGAVLWERSADVAPRPTRILPDGCMDLIWDGSRLFVAGPDTSARMHTNRRGARYAAVRFSGGLGPALLGVPAHELRDRAPDIAAMWPSRLARELAERVADDPAATLRDWVHAQAVAAEVNQLGPRVLQLAGCGMPVADIAERLAMSPRQLHRRCLPLFGYGPARLSRVLRMHRALDRARAGMPLAQAAATCGYADQAHLSRDIGALAGTTPQQLVRELNLR